MTETPTSTETQVDDDTVDVFVLDDGEGQPGVVPALVLDTAPLRMAVSYPDGTIREHGAAAAPLPASDVAALSNEPFSDDTPLWVLSLSTEAPAGVWAQHLRRHCPQLVSMILGLWPVDGTTPALHVRGYSPAGAALAVALPLTTPARRNRVEALIETDQRRLLEEACDWT